MDKSISVLDHGYVKLITAWGSDQEIVETARQSTQRGFLGWGPKHVTGCVPGMGGDYDHCSCGGREPGDEKFLRFLDEHKHSTPFEFCGATFEVQAPIFVFREWHRHRTQSYSEASARYAPLPDVNYIPSVERLMVNSKTNKQAGTAKGADELTLTAAQAFRENVEHSYEEQEKLYQQALSGGVPKELARVILPVGRYSKMRASTDLRNWMSFLTLRNDENAQWEIRQYAIAVQVFLVNAFPRSMELFTEKRP